MRQEHEEELAELHQKMDAEKQTKAKMQQEVELMKQQYEDKLKVRKNIFEHCFAALRRCKNSPLRCMVNSEVRSA